MAGGRNARNLHWIVSALLRIADDTMDWTTQPPPPSFLTQHEAGTHILRILCADSRPHSLRFVI
jgi:hypothetical protein